MKKKNTILIIDDEESIRTLCSVILKRQGFDVITAVNGKEGQEMFTDHQQDITLTIIDLVMPIMDGDEVIAEINKDFPDSQIILTSASTQMNRIDSACETINVSFLPKPFNIPKLLSAVGSSIH